MTGQRYSCTRTGREGKTVSTGTLCLKKSQTAKFRTTPTIVVRYQHKFWYKELPLNQHLLALPRTHNTFGDRGFAAARSCVWNSLPVHLRDEDIVYRTLKRGLKTHLF